MPRVILASEWYDSVAADTLRFAGQNRGLPRLFEPANAKAACSRGWPSVTCGGVGYRRLSCATLWAEQPRYGYSL
jgi:hypothetical protein